MADGAESAFRLCDVGCMMYPMVQQQQQQTTQQQRQQQDEADAEQQESSSTSRHRPHRPLYRRFFSYVREAWTGVKFALGKLKYTSDNYRLSAARLIMQAVSAESQPVSYFIHSVGRLFTAMRIRFLNFSGIIYFIYVTLLLTKSMSFPNTYLFEFYIQLTIKRLNMQNPLTSSLKKSLKNHAIHKNNY